MNQNNNSRPFIDYTNKDYESLRQSMLDLAREKLPEWTDHSPNDLGVVLLELFSYMGDMLFYHQDRIANESYLDTAVERRSVINLLSLIGYQMRPPRPASADLTLLFDPEAKDQEVTIEQGYTFSTDSKLTGQEIKFCYIKDSLSFKIGDLLYDSSSPDGKIYRVFSPLPVVQVDDKVDMEIVSSSDGSPGQRFRLARLPLIEGTLSVNVKDTNPPQWVRQPTLLYSYTGDHHYVVSRDAEDRVWLEFGDGKYGKIPPKGVNNIKASYLVGGGTKGNVPPQSIVKFPSSIVKLEQAFNLEAAAGGADAETIDEAAYRGPRMFRTMGRAVTASDYEAHALEFGVGKARTTAANWNRIKLYIAPVGGGYPSDTLKEDLRHYLDNKRVLTSIIEIEDPIYVNLQIKGTLEIEPYYYEAEVRQQVGRVLHELLAFENVDFLYKIHLSKLYEAIEAIEGVASVYITHLLRANAGVGEGLLPSTGFIETEWNEIPQIGSINWEFKEGGWRWTISV